MAHRTVDRGPDNPADHVSHGAHPGPAEYVKIAIVLAVITAVEVALYYIDLGKGVLIVTLLVLSAAKFILVVLWFMHLKFDNKLFSWFFASGFVVALTAFLAVLAMFRVFF